MPLREKRATHLIVENVLRKNAQFDEHTKKERRTKDPPHGSFSNSELK
jgi:hypothetical protein